MRLYLSENVFDAALNRVRRIYDEFPNVVVSVSGGKDSTVLFNLALMVAEEKGRLPVDVFFLDQEAEWEATIDHIRRIMHDPRVRPHWFQGPFKLFNATSADDPWLYCWKEGAEWIREKEPDSIHTNETGTDRFKKLFGAYVSYRWPKQPVAQLAGVRCEESPSRRLGLTSLPTYKEITWGCVYSRRWHQYTFYPLYDWCIKDVWKAIHDHGWPYNRLYDYMFQYGMDLRHMRVSNPHHETAIHTLEFLQEIEPDTWNRITARLSGVNAVKNCPEAYRCPSELPWMFGSWEEYRDYLLDNLIHDPDKHAAFRSRFDRLHHLFVSEIHDRLCREEINAILLGDYEGTKLMNWEAANRKIYGVNDGRRADRYTAGVRKQDE